MLKSLCLLAALLPACTDRPPPKSTAENVPANSASDARLHGEEDPSDHAARQQAASRETHVDPSQPYVTKVGEARSPEPDDTPHDGSPSTAAETKKAVAKSDCDHMMDKYIELEIARNPKLQGVSPELIDQAKQMAREKHGAAPCTATSAQYRCAMAATSPAAWQKCVK